MFDLSQVVPPGASGGNKDETGDLKPDSTLKHCGWSHVMTNVALVGSSCRDCAHQTNSRSRCAGILMPWFGIARAGVTVGLKLETISA